MNLEKYLECLGPKPERKLLKTKSIFIHVIFLKGVEKVNFLRNKRQTQKLKW